MRHATTSRPRGFTGLSVFLKRLSVTVICLLVLANISALGQSGRKQKKPTPEPPVQGVNQPPPETKTEPAPETPPEKPKEKGPSILVATEMPEIGIPLVFTQIAREGCMRELRQVRTLDIREARDINRGEAINTAKKEDNIYVVWMELRADQFSSGGFDLRYTIFEPKTAKVAGTGSGYPVASNSRLPEPPLGASYIERRIELAARDVARQVMKRLHLGNP